MSENFNQIFVLPNGTEIEVRDSYMGKYLALCIQRIYHKPEDQKDNILMPEQWQEVDCRKFEVNREYVSRENHKIRSCTETMIIAENKNWQEYPLIKAYTGEHCDNCEYYTKIEVVLMDEDYSRRLIFDWKGNLTLGDFADDCAERIVQKIVENPGAFYAKVENENSHDPIIYLEFYNDNGEYYELELDGVRAIEGKIASIRVIEFTEKIIDRN